MREWPSQGDLVVCTVAKVMDFGVFAELDEYGRKEGLIHISEVAAGWVKYIRDYLREGQKIVCKVLSVNPKRGHIDLSYKDVNEHQRRDKIQEWKSELRAEKWLNFAIGDEAVERKLADTIIDSFGSLYNAFEETVMSGRPVLIDAGIDEEYAIKIEEVAIENVKIPSVDITGFVDLTCPAPDGVDAIKRSLATAAIVNDDHVVLEISYVGAPRYRIHVTAPDYKLAERILKESAKRAIDEIEHLDGEGTFHRHEE
ncbi:MAG: translation initiation factor IF-2 subunit alpha [Candidatus Methanogaster sp.]|uniref:Translation initiation factor IF-2 subunit alpha n=1 Tax=Candidatus Methanogaster sp. TaxID=3386292 RepID=A0AC61L6J3_9EURY|nr:MAG: translation initiation factor IF-2 subunit alpha [ANME-2 cluster archaeon]